MEGASYGIYAEVVDVLEIKRVSATISDTSTTRT